MTLLTGICLTSNKNLQWASGGEVWAKIALFGTIFSLKIGVLFGKYFRKQTQFFSRPPLTVPVHCHLQGRETFFWQGLKIDIFEPLFFLLTLRFRSKLKQDVNISPFVNHSMLRNPGALDTFLHANQMKMYTWDKIVNFRNFCSPLSFF